jgi:hypothetical protein
MRKSCDSDDCAWARSFFSSTSTDRSSGSFSFLQGSHRSLSFDKSPQSMSSMSACGFRSLKSMFEGLGAKISWMEKW